MGEGIDPNLKSVNTDQWNTEQLGSTSSVSQGATVEGGAQAAILKPRYWYADSTVNGEGPTLALYSAKAGAPALPQPVPEGTGISSSASPLTDALFSTFAAAEQEETFDDVHNQVFEDVAKEYVAGLKLSPEEAAKKLAELRFAYFHPELAEASSKEAVSALQGAINRQIDLKGLSTPTGWQPDPEGFDVYAKQTYDYSFSDLADGLVDENGESQNEALSGYLAAHTKGMSEEEADGFVKKTLQHIKTLHYHPEYEIDGKADLAPIVAQLNMAASKAIALKLGVPESVQGSFPTPDSALYDRVIGADYRFKCEVALRDALASQSPPLSADQEAMIRNYMNNPSVTIGASLKALADGIMLNIRTEIVKTYGLPTEWAPVGGVSLPDSNSVMLKALLAMDDMMRAAKSQIEVLGEGSVKIFMKDYLKAIGDAISGLQKQIYEMQEKNVIASKLYTQAVSDTTQGRIKAQEEAMEKQKAKQAEIAKQQEKAGTISLVMKIVMPLVIVVTVIATIASFGTLGPVGIAVVCLATSAMILDSAGVTVGGKSLSQAFFQDGIGKLGTLMGMNQRDSEIMGAVLTMVAACALMAAGGGPGALTAALAVVTQVISNSSVVQNIVLASGGDEKLAMIVSLVVMGVLILGSIAAAYKSSAGVSQAAAEAKLAETTGDIAEVQAQIVAKFAQDGSRSVALEMKKLALEIKEFFLQIGVKALRDPETLNGVNAVLDVGLAATTAVNTENEWTLSQKQIDLLRLRTESEAADVGLQATIDGLKDQIRKLQQISQQILAMLSGTAKIQEKKYVTVNFPV